MLLAYKAQHPVFYRFLSRVLYSEPTKMQADCRTGSQSLRIAVEELELSTWRSRVIVNMYGIYTIWYSVYGICYILGGSREL